MNSRQELINSNKQSLICKVITFLVLLITLTFQNGHYFFTPFFGIKGRIFGTRQAPPPGGSVHWWIHESTRRVYTVCVHFFSRCVQATCSHSSARPIILHIVIFSMLRIFCLHFLRKFLLNVITYLQIDKFLIVAVYNAILQINPSNRFTTQRGTYVSYFDKVSENRWSFFIAMESTLLSYFVKYEFGTSGSYFGKMFNIISWPVGLYNVAAYSIYSSSDAIWGKFFMARRLTCRSYCAVYELGSHRLLSDKLYNIVLWPVGLYNDTAPLCPRSNTEVFVYKYIWFCYIQCRSS